MASTVHIVQQAIDLASTLSLLQWLAVVAFWVGTQIAAYFVYTRWAIRRSWRFHQQLKRPIIILEPRLATGGVVPGAELADELKLIQETGFLNASKGLSDYRSYNPADDHCLVVLGYKPEMAGLDDFLARIKTKHVPLIVYTYGNNRVPDADRFKFESYPKFIYANFPLTLLNSIFATVASYPYGRR